MSHIKDIIDAVAKNKVFVLTAIIVLFILFIIGIYLLVVKWNLSIDKMGKIESKVEQYQQTVEIVQQKVEGKDLAFHSAFLWEDVHPYYSEIESVLNTLGKKTSAWGVAYWGLWLPIKSGYRTVVATYDPTPNGERTLEYKSKEGSKWNTVDWRQKCLDSDDILILISGMPDLDLKEISTMPSTQSYQIINLSEQLKTDIDMKNMNWNPRLGTVAACARTAYGGTPFAEPYGYIMVDVTPQSYEELQQDIRSILDNLPLARLKVEQIGFTANKTRLQELYYVFKHHVENKPIKNHNF